jgi:hypothetical protein
MLVLVRKHALARLVPVGTGIWYLVGTRYLVPNVPVPGTLYLVPNVPVPGTLVSGTVCRD